VSTETNEELAGAELGGSDIVIDPDAAPTNGTNGTKAKATASQQAASVVIPKVAASTLRIPIRGTSPLIVHKFSQKAKQTMLDNMQGRKQPKEPRDPDADYRASLYLHDDETPGLPVLAFKASTVSAARLFDKSVTMTMLRQCLFFTAEWSEKEQVQLVRINGEHQMREDVVRVGNGGTDLRYRAMFPTWTTHVDVTYVKSMLSRESVLSLIDAAGMGVGVGEWRPEKSGDFGCFSIDTDREVEVIAE
jgi:hypothetical protein